MRTWHKIIIGDSRCMKEIPDESVHFIVTSPPYWQLKDYANYRQIGFNDTSYLYLWNKTLINAHLIKNDLVNIDIVLDL